jgi:hypothetical protein
MRCSCNSCPATFRFSEARNRQNTLCPGSLLTFRIPVSIGSWATKTKVIEAGKPHVDCQHHPQYELIDGHDARDAPDCQVFVDELLKAQLL